MFATTVAMLGIAASLYGQNCGMNYQNPTTPVPNPISTYLSVTPSTAVIAPADSIELSVTGGTAPYALQVTTGTSSGSIAAGATASTHRFTAGESETTARIRVSDAVGASVTASITISTSSGGDGTLAISPSSVSVAAGSSTTLTASGGTPPYQFSISGAGTGVGTVTQTSTTQARFTAANVNNYSTVIVQDGVGARAYSEISITGGSTTELSVNASSGAIGPGGRIYVSVLGGKAPFTFESQQGRFDTPRTSNRYATYTAPTPFRANRDVLTITDGDGIAQTLTIQLNRNSVLGCSGTWRIFTMESSNACDPDAPTNARWTGTLTLSSNNTGTILFSGGGQSTNAVSVTRCTDTGEITFVRTILGYGTQTYTGQLNREAESEPMSGQFTDSNHDSVRTPSRPGPWGWCAIR